MTTTRPKTSAVVSLYNPDSEVVDNVRTLLQQVDTVVAVDDGSPDDPAPLLARLESLGCTIVRLSRNSGIAAALNAGISAARQQNEQPPAFVLTMDQDSLLEDGYVDKLLAAVEQATEAGISVGMAMPGSIRGLIARRAGQVNGIALGGEPIQSGLLIPVAVLDRLGDLLTDLFIDGVDTEFYLRCREAGYHAVIAESAGLNHSLGSMRPAVIFGLRLSIAGRPVLIRTAATHRYYYIFRNRILLVTRYWRHEPWWAVKGVLADYRHLMIVTVLVPERLGRLRAVISGVRDGRRGITGPRRFP